MTSFRMYDYIAPPKWMIERIDNPLHSMIIVGSMGSGKTTWTLSIIAKAIERLFNDGVDDEEIAVIHTQGLSMLQTMTLFNTSNIDFKRIRYLFWFNDDAPRASGQHGRRSMSRENVEESQFYIMIRHELERKGFNGFLFIAHATQVYHLLDITFRRTAKVKAFKDYPDEPSDLRIIGPMLRKAYLRKLREITRKIFAPKSYEEMVEGLSSAVVKFIALRKVVKVERKNIPRSVIYISNNLSEDTAYQLISVPPISKTEFRRLVRERAGIHADNYNIDTLYELLMKRLGYITRREKEATIVG